MEVRMTERYQRAVTLIQALQVFDLVITQHTEYGTDGCKLLLEARKHVSAQLSDLIHSNADFLHEIQAAFEAGFPEFDGHADGRKLLAFRRVD